MKKSILTLLCLIMMSAQTMTAKTVTVTVERRKPVPTAVHRDKGPHHKKDAHMKKHHGQHNDCKKCTKWHKYHGKKHHKFNKHNKRHVTK